MKTTLPSQLRLFEGTQEQARTLMQELLARRKHPVMIVKKAIIPAVEASGQALKLGSLLVGALPELGIMVQAVMEELNDSLRKAGLSFHFRIGRACDDVFDLWGAEIAGAFEAAGFRTSRSAELNRCEAIRVREFANSAVGTSEAFGNAGANGWLRAAEIWQSGIIGSRVARDETTLIKSPQPVD